MTTYTFTCEDNTWDTQADSKEAALETFMGMEEVQAHMKEAHPEMASMSEDQMKAEGLKMISEKPAQA